MTTPWYRLFGLSIESPFVLPGAPLVDKRDEAPDVTVRWEDDATWDGAGWRTTWASPRAGWPTVSVDIDDSRLLAWGDHMKFVISAQGDRIRIVSDHASLEFAPTVLVGFVLGYALHLRGTLCLHGCVLVRGDRAFSLLGDSGTGKSTVAAALVLHGAALLSDDMTVLRRTPAGVVAEPGCATVRLSTDSAAHLLGPAVHLPKVPYVGKLLWEPASAEGADHRYCDRPVLLEVLYVLDAVADAVDVEVGPALSPQEALRRLVAAWYPPNQLHLLTQPRLNELSALAADVPVRVVRYAKQWEQLPRLVERLGA